MLLLCYSPDDSLHRVWIIAGCFLPPAKPTPDRSPSINSLEHIGAMAYTGKVMISLTHDHHQDKLTSLDHLWQGSHARMQGLPGGEAFRGG